jgi:hypothetical protein
MEHQIHAQIGINHKKKLLLSRTTKRNISRHSSLSTSYTIKRLLSHRQRSFPVEVSFLLYFLHYFFNKRLFPSNSSTFQ